MASRNRSFASLTLALAAGALAQSDTALTIYSTTVPGGIPAEMYRPAPVPGYAYGYNPYAQQPIPGYAVVRQERMLELAQGRGRTSFTDVAAYIDPTTVTFESLTDPAGTKVLEQDYRFDLLSMEKMLQRYIDKTVNVNGQDVMILSVTMGGMLVREADGRVRFMQGYGDVRFPEVAEGLITRPTLIWDVFAGKGGAHRTRVTYQTSGITWWADYNLVFAPDSADANAGTLDVGAWVSILNRSGATYDDAKLKLMAGDVHRAPQANYAGAYPMGQGRFAANEAMPAGFAEKGFFEYHLYTLGRPTTIPDNSTKQVELFEPARGVPVEKVLVYYGLAEGYRGFFPNPMTDRNFGTEMNKKVDIYLRFENAKENGLGIPLPAGRIRVNQVDPEDGSMEFIGEDVVDHTPKDEDVLIRMGSAFDVVGERVQADFTADYNRGWLEETIEIKVRNHKEQVVDVIVKENLYRWVNWEVTASTHEWEKQDARTIHFPITVRPDGEAVVRYTVRYSW